MLTDEKVERIERARSKCVAPVNQAFTTPSNAKYELPKGKSIVAPKPRFAH
jgi:hypothetical protein